ncbi:MAG: nucleotidyl transferase AbiEii/AbiGii toxin family protein [Propionibacteriaceae bacterium]|jgi:predicted nucleotidyltransferase component of viral defense system|nr:nucleotidyl transferase AbiEii/AbiGii toxin family protein [Propionibacteriaceae bacterium]
MIGRPAIAAWRDTHPWQTDKQVEQDLLLSRAMVEIARHSLLGRELLLRGGTAIQKLHLGSAVRYSEDLDYVRLNPGPLGPIMQALQDIGEAVGLRPSWRLGEHPKVFWRGTAADGSPLKIKIELDTRQRDGLLPPITAPFSVESPWWSGTTDVPTPSLVDVAGSKLAALYSRSKGRDLLDTWLVRTRTTTDPAQVVTAARRYGVESMTWANMTTNLTRKLADPHFSDDTTIIVTPGLAYDPVEAAAIVQSDLVDRLPGGPLHTAQPGTADAGLTPE